MTTENMEKVKILSENLIDCVPIREKDVKCGAFIPHPFTNNIFSMASDGRVLNLLKEEDFKVWSNQLRERINDKATGLYKIYAMLNKAYRLFWFSLVCPYMTPEEYGEFLNDVWISSENPNMDVNVSLEEAVRLFDNADKKCLMSEEDFEVYKNITDTITLYRGVSVGREPYGLSYTASTSKADWFKNRFGNDGSFIITLQVKKEDVLAYLNSRGEDEYVVNAFKYKKEIAKQLKQSKQ